MNEHRHQHAITTMCKVLRIARAEFYQWLHKPVSDRDQDNHQLLQLIRSYYTASRGVYGARRVFSDLLEAGETCGKHRVARLKGVIHHG
jgi:putative transposase